ncbi:MAG: histidine--tRNA ligase [Eubacteriales bacterium]|nr:histidine--tRNA ligase [Eubacteriales bacterium]
MKLTAPKGTRDILPSEIGKWHFVEKQFMEVCSLFGYDEIRIPTFESTEVFSRGVGDDTDVVQKEMYTFDDKGGRSISLRPEGTAGIARSFIENGMGSMPFPIKLCYNITAFRYENVQKGRYREFHQLGAEAFGSAGPRVDAELISMISLFFRRLGIYDSMLRINSIGCPECRKKYNDSLKGFLLERYEGLCKVCRDRYEANPLRVLDCKDERCKTVTAEAPLLADSLCNDCADHFVGLQEALSDLDIDYEIDKRIVRGLDYYTRTVFEFISENVGTQGTICGGGRYDGLIDQFGGGCVPGIGFALGVERLLMEMDSRGLVPGENKKVSLYIASLGDETVALAHRLCFDLRKNGIAAETDLTGRSFRAALKYAGKAGFTHLMIIGKDETDSGVVKLKSLKDASEKDYDLTDLVERLKEEFYG